MNSRKKAIENPETSLFELNSCIYFGLENTLCNFTKLTICHGLSTLNLLSLIIVINLFNLMLTLFFSGCHSCFVAIRCVVSLYYLGGKCEASRYFSGTSLRDYGFRLWRHIYEALCFYNCSCNSLTLK